MQQPVLDVRSVSKSFTGVQALNAVDFTVHPGEVHCLAGENGSGKSTLIKCVTGTETIDSGSIILEGSEYHGVTPSIAMDHGIQVIYQDLALFPNLSVAENIAFISLLNRKTTLVSPDDCSDIAKIAMERLRARLNLDAIVENLSMADKQQVAICRALALNARLIFMDEPTTALTRHEIDNLLATIDDLRSHGIAVVFVSHKLDEVFQIADNIAVLRDGKKVGDFPNEEIDEKKLTFYMTGKEVASKTFERTHVDTQPVLQIEHLSRTDHYSDVSLHIEPGEVVGLIGPLGAGRTELALSIFGLNPPDEGEIHFAGKRVSINSPDDAKRLGIGLVPEDRHGQGLFARLPVGSNITASIVSRLRRGLRIKPEDISARGLDLMKRFRVRENALAEAVQNLSGGNQQRVVLGRWVAIDPKLLILDSPTVGIDVASKSEIHHHVQDLAQRGIAILMISDEVPEVYHNCNRILFMRDGRIQAEIDPTASSENELRELVEGRTTV